MCSASNSLPEPDSQRPALAQQFVAPQTAEENALARVWQDVLGLERVGINDNFFNLGGHSLLATQVMSRTRQAFNVEIPLRQFFQTPTISGLARCIEERMLRGARAELPAIKNAARDQSLPLSFAQQRLWFLWQLEPGSAFYNVPISLRLKGRLNVEALERA